MKRKKWKNISKLRKFLGLLATDPQLQKSYVASIGNSEKKAEFFADPQIDLAKPDKKFFINANQEAIDLAILVESEALLITWASR